MAAFHILRFLRSGRWHRLLPARQGSASLQPPRPFSCERPAASMLFGSIFLYVMAQPCAQKSRRFREGCRVVAPRVPDECARSRGKRPDSRIEVPDSVQMQQEHGWRGEGHRKEEERYPVFQSSHPPRFDAIPIVAHKVYPPVLHVFHRYRGISYGLFARGLPKYSG